MRRSDLVQNDGRNSPQRTTQIVFGERQHLLRVLDSLEGSQLPPARRNHERRVLEELIHARTKELNEVNASWDEKVGMVLSAEAIEFFREQSKDKLPSAPLFTEHGEHLGVVMSGQKQCAPRSQKESDKFALMAVINLGQLHGTCACRAPTWFIAPLLAQKDGG